MFYIFIKENPSIISSFEWKEFITAQQIYIAKQERVENTLTKNYLKQN